MRSRLLIWASALAIVLAASPAVAWNCPVLIKSAEDAIKRAEAMQHGPEAQALIELAKKTVADAKKDHTSASSKAEHANAMWKAKAAQAQAEAAAALATP